VAQRLFEFLQESMSWLAKAILTHLALGLAQRQGSAQAPGSALAQGLAQALELALAQGLAQALELALAQGLAQAPGPARQLGLVRGPVKARGQARSPNSHPPPAAALGPQPCMPTACANQVW
jgi:hypothetical protein